MKHANEIFKKYWVWGKPVYIQYPYSIITHQSSLKDTIYARQFVRTFEKSDGKKAKGDRID